jgi:hypothetical protein
VPSFTLGQVNTAFILHRCQLVQNIYSVCL